MRTSATPHCNGSACDHRRGWALLDSFFPVFFLSQTSINNRTFFEIKLATCLTKLILQCICVCERGPFNIKNDYTIDQMPTPIFRKEIFHRFNFQDVPPPESCLAEAGDCISFFSSSIFIWTTHLIGVVRSEFVRMLTIVCEHVQHAGDPSCRSSVGKPPFASIRFFL